MSTSKYSTLPRTIVFFDIPTRLGAPNSPNTWKVRLLLNFKGLEYATRWVPTTDIERVCRALGIPPTGVKPSGEPHYTLPAIVDNSLAPPVTLADSVAIMEYLDDTYRTPSWRVFPDSSRALHTVFQTFLDLNISAHLLPLMVMHMYRSKLPEDQRHFRARLENTYGRRLEDIEAQGEEREQLWRRIEGVFGSLAQSLATNGGGEFFMGKSPSFADFALCALLIFFRNASPSEAWNKIKSWDGGRWEAFYGACESWMRVDYHPA